MLFTTLQQHVKTPVSRSYEASLCFVLSIQDEDLPVPAGTLALVKEEHEHMRVGVCLAGRLICATLHIRRVAYGASLL